jgi:hypothetical protein
MTGCQQFGITYQEGAVPGTEGWAEGDDSQGADLRTLELGHDNGVPFRGKK